MSKSARVPLQLDTFLPYRLSVLSNTVSTAIAGAYHERFGLSIQRASLDNGLKVVMNPDHSAPTVAVSVTYGVGSLVGAGVS